MELDDLKEKWKSTTFQSPFELKDSLERRITALEHSGSGLRRVFIIEMMIIGVIYVGFILMLWFMAEAVASYMYKLVAVTTIATIPVSWRMYKSQKWINSMDYTKDVRSNMVEFLHYYKVTLRLYQWSTYVTIIVSLALMFTDSEFESVPSGAKVTLVIYMSVLFVLTEPYIRIVYGRRIAVFETFLND